MEAGTVPDDVRQRYLAPQSSVAGSSPDDLIETQHASPQHSTTVG
jgi:hypothetical protein